MFLPNEVLSDISDFLPNDDVEDLVFLSRAFATVTAKRLPIINETYEFPFERHVDVNELLEDYAWNMFDLARQKKNSNLKKFKDMKKDKAIFNINRKHLNLVHDDPIYRNVRQTEYHRGTSVKLGGLTNNTSNAQQFSVGAERASKSVFEISRLQGYTFGAEAELSLKIPREIAEFKTGFKYETHFNSLADNVQSETLIWGKNLAIKGIVPAKEKIKASFGSEVVSYSGHYTLVSTLSGEVTVNISTRFGVFIHRITFNVATAFQHYLAKSKPRLKRVVTIDHGKVKLTSKGTCHFEFTLNQYVELNATSPKQTFVVTNVNTASSTVIGGAGPTDGVYATTYPLAPTVEEIFATVTWPDEYRAVTRSIEQSQKIITQTIEVLNTSLLDLYSIRFADGGVDRFLSTTGVLNCDKVTFTRMRLTNDMTATFAKWIQWKQGQNNYRRHLIFERCDLRYDIFLWLKEEFLTATSTANYVVSFVAYKRCTKISSGLLNGKNLCLENGGTGFRFKTTIKSISMPSP
ncbi:CBR-LIN-24 protein [Ditylenchus destructor]|nr:CBR-LIN-24 protein [Ditylenchus destructor]